MQSLLADMGRLDVLVNNAGITRDCSLSKLQPGDWGDVIRTTRVPRANGDGWVGALTPGQKDEPVGT